MDEKDMKNQRDWIDSVPNLFLIFTIGLGLFIAMITIEKKYFEPKVLDLSKSVFEVVSKREHLGFEETTVRDLVSGCVAKVHLGRMKSDCQVVGD